MNFKNEFVTHRKIDFFHFATIEKYASQGYMVDFGSAKNTIIKSTINKNHSNKIALREITTVESTAFKFLQIDFLFTVSDVVVFDVKKVLGHK
jgi:NifB/MoaA-like Fe-S oxidoreductase